MGELADDPQQPQGGNEPRQEKAMSQKFPKPSEYRKFRPGQVIRSKIDNTYGPAGSLFKIMDVSDGRGPSRSTVPISATLLNKKGLVNRRRASSWAGFTKDQVEIVYQDHNIWLNGPKKGDFVALCYKDMHGFQPMCGLVKKVSNDRMLTLHIELDGTSIFVPSNIVVKVPVVWSDNLKLVVSEKVKAYPAKPEPKYTGRRANPGDGPGIHRDGSPYEHAD
jgi:hypothetical protein